MKSENVIVLERRRGKHLEYISIDERFILKRISEELFLKI
jgi:hypothetical protein